MLKNIFQCVNGSNECMLWGPKDLIVFIVMGAVGGLLGALFNQLNLYITKYRINHVNPKGRIVRLFSSNYFRYYYLVFLNFTIQIMSNKSIIPT